jgi:membrane associated rhomboid family serine protease
MMNGMQLPKIDPVNKVIIICLVTLFVLNGFSGFAGLSLYNYMSLSLEQLISGKVWTLFTYPLLPGGLIELIFNALIIWFIGSELSLMWGKNRYLQFIGATMMGAAFTTLAIQAFNFAPMTSTLAGASAFCSALCVAYGILNPERTMYFFFFPLQAKWFVIILVGMNLYNGIFSPGGVLAWSQLGAMASGYAWMIWISKNGASTGPKRRKKVNKGHLSIVKSPLEQEEPEEDKPTYH